MHIPILSKRMYRATFAAVGLGLSLFFLHTWRRHGLDINSMHLVSWPSTARQEGKESGKHDYATTSQFRPVSFSDIENLDPKELCESFPHHLLQRIQPVLKIGHYDINHGNHLDAQLQGPSRCIKSENLLVFSDLDETVGVHQAIDILATLPGVYRNTTKWENYLTMQELRQNGTLDTDEEATKSIQGWNLDSLKFLAEIEQAWIRKPGRDWYVFYETDTYIFWDNMFRFLMTLDPGTPMYMGSPTPGRMLPAPLKHQKGKERGTWFANGGPGFVMSRAAMEKILHREVDKSGQYTTPSLTEKEHELASQDCCGDSVLGWVLWNSYIPVSGYWPQFSPHAPSYTVFSDTHWCQPPLTMHKCSMDEVKELSQWEYAARKRYRPLLYRDLYDIVDPGSTRIRDNWDSGDWRSFEPSNKVESFGQCAKACESAKDCLQYKWVSGTETRCLLMRQISLGVEKQPSEEKGKDVAFKSGWMTERIEKWRKDRPCEEVDWVSASLQRVFRP